MNLGEAMEDFASEVYWSQQESTYWHLHTSTRSCRIFSLRPTQALEDHGNNIRLPSFNWP